MTSRPAMAVVTPARTSSGGSAFSAELVPALREILGGEEVVEWQIPPVARVDLPESVIRAHSVVFAGSRAVPVRGSRVVFWPLNVAPLERHVARAHNSSLRNRLRHLALLRRLDSSVRAANGLVFGSMHARSLYQAAFPAGATKSYLINPGGTPSGVPRIPATESGAPLVLLVSHLYPYKGILEFVEAVAEAVVALPPEVSFRVAGADRDRAYSSAVHARVRELGLGDRLQVAPADPEEMAGLYARATLAVFTSTCENAGSFALYDGLHAGAPTLCSDRSSMPEMVGDHVRLVNPCDTRDLAREIVDLLGDSSARTELAKRARAWSAAAPTWDQRARLLVDFVDTLEGE